mmetsp:Transcript_34600/g.67744  ORF Transcript_34600/g.67744 Transcript_34600/m.67744 type:complete len:395 (-) Transcript_34600:164-1348(-)
MWSAELSRVLIHCSKLLELHDALIQSSHKRVLLLEHNLSNLLGGKPCCWVKPELRESFTEELNDERNKRGKEASLVRSTLGEQILTGIANTSPQHTTNNIVASVRPRKSSVVDRDGESPDVICDDPVCHIDTISIFLSDLSRVRPDPSLLSDGLEDRNKNVRVVVRPLVLEDGGDALETHASVDMLARKDGQALVLVAEHLDEDHVPDLKHVGVVHVDEACGVPSSDAIEVKLCAGPAGASVAHLPEVVLHVALEHSVRGEILKPQIPGLVVARHGASEVLISLAVSGVEAVSRQLVHLGEQLPCPGDGLLLEVVSEGPVAKHLKEGVVVHILAHVIQVIVLAARSDALLAVARRGELGEGGLGVDGAGEDGLVLVHASVDEQQGGVVVGHDGA